MSDELENAKAHLRALIDPVWQCGKRTRKGVYFALSAVLKYDFTIDGVATVEEARRAYKTAKDIL